MQVSENVELVEVGQALCKLNTVSNDDPQRLILREPAEEAWNAYQTSKLIELKFTNDKR